jgi:predicted transporter
MSIMPITLSKPSLWFGWILSAIPAAFLLSGSVTAWLGIPQVAQGITHLGYPMGMLRVIGSLELLCGLLYIIPRTAILGAILMTGYLGGAVASHLRVGESQWVVAVVFGFIAWTGLILRDVRARAAFAIATDKFEDNPALSPASARQTSNGDGNSASLA